MDGFISVNGARLHYEVAGSGPPVVLIHSGITDSRSWNPQFKEFARDFRVLRYDLRGFGQSDVPQGTYSSVSDLVALLDAAGMGRAAFVGVSMGGALALDLALEHSERVSALVLVASGFSGRKPSESFKAVMGEIETLWKSGLIDEAVERELQVWLDGKGRSAADVDPELREAVRLMDRQAAERFPPDAKPQPIDPPAAGRFSEIRVPTLVVIGDLDLDDIRGAANQLAAGITGARQVVMHGVAHVPNMEHPEEFNRVVIDFLRSVTDRGLPDRALT